MEHKVRFDVVGSIVVTLKGDDLGSREELQASLDAGEFSLHIHEGEPVTKFDLATGYETVGEVVDVEVPEGTEFTDYEVLVD